MTTKIKIQLISSMVEGSYKTMKSDLEFFYLDTLRDLKPNIVRKYETDISHLEGSIIRCMLKK